MIKYMEYLDYMDCTMLRNMSHVIKKHHKAVTCKFHLVELQPEQFCYVITFFYQTKQ